MGKEKSCGAVLCNKQKDGSIKYLLLHYESGHWDFPKGNQEQKESEEQTVAREIKEETGIKDIEFVKGFREVVKYFYRKDEEVIYKEVAFYVVRTKTEKVWLSFEHIGYAWMSYEKAYKRLTYNNAKVMLENANRFLSKG